MTQIGTASVPPGRKSESPENRCMRLSWRTQKTTQTFRQKRPTWRMHSAQVRFRWRCIGRRLMRCSHPLKESRSLTPKDDGCPGGIAPVVARREAPGKSEFRAQDKTRCQTTNPQPRKTANPQRLPTAKIDFAPSVGSATNVYQ